MHKINVDQIMIEIRNEIKEKGYRVEELKFQDIPIPAMPGADNGKYSKQEMTHQVSKLNKNWNNPMFFPFPSRNPVKIAFQKTLRKLSKCVFWPIVNYQNIFNSSLVRTINQVKYYMDETEDRIQKLEKYQKEDILKAIETISRQLMAVKWKQIDEISKVSEKPKDFITCKICGYQAMRSSYETKISECIFNGGRLERYVCPECGVIFGPSKFSDRLPHDIDEDYKVHYFGFNEGSSYDKEMEAFYMLEPEKDKVYLNYGCGCWSKSIQRLREQGYQVYGYEPYAPETDNPYMITKKEELIKLKFDGIYSNDLLEHLLNPIDDIRFMKTLLMRCDSKMSHSTACFAYKHEYTRFHTHFYTGKSVEYLCNIVGLDILNHCNALEERDFICYVFGKKGKDNTDLKPGLHVSENGERKGNTIILHPKSYISGPYMIQGPDRYELTVQVQIPDEQKIELKITADSGHLEIASFPLINGINHISYELKEFKSDMEFVIYHEKEFDITINELSLH